jgi:hypothetical protein
VLKKLNFSILFSSKDIKDIVKSKNKLKEMVLENQSLVRELEAKMASLNHEYQQQLE